MSDGGVQQVGLSSWSERQLVEPADRKHGDRKIRCPDCGQSLGRTHGGHPLPDDLRYERTFGWRCSDCHNVLPCRAFNPEADTFNDKYRGAMVEFRDGSTRYIPVPTAEVENRGE